ncbi:hypothetical protein B0H39_003786 [Clostridium beijerinckii]|uniref:hypothetical protein n=1 Tax=Clostridium beijerinckii TaxID=1520 RepID=UPI001493F326|nr:hypothetical protein [Clostridium beijerinckii]NOW85905.1 hypothetical protein [Clostridium beijerinckii]
MNTILSFNINIGDLNDVKVQRIQEILKPDFQGAVSMPNQLVLTGNAEQIILTPVQVQYSCTHEYFDRIQSNIIKIQELFMLDQVINRMTVLFADTQDLKVDVMKYSKEKFGSLISDSLGIGKREFFQYNGSLSEIKVEPLLNDNKNLYIQGLYNLSLCPISEINNVLNEIKVDYNRKKEEIFKNLQ